MRRFLIEHLPRNAARYLASPMEYAQAKSWIEKTEYTSLVRTTELIAAVGEGMGITLAQSDLSVRLAPGDEALLISLSFSVLLASAEGAIPPLPEDWRCTLLIVEAPGEVTAPVPAFAVEEELTGSEPV